MASSLKIVCGNYQFNLNDRVSFFMHQGYYPSVIGIATDAEEKTLTETVTVQLRGAISPNIQSLNRLFEQARRNDPAEDKVYIEYKIAEDEDAWRSRIRDGIVEVMPSVAQDWKRKRVVVDISFERDAWWEGPEQVLPIGNANGGDVARVFNANDGAGSAPNKRINAAHITGNMILGDMPTPVTLEIENLYNKSLGGLWIGLNNTRPNWLSGWSFEAESATGIEPYPVAGASGGAIARGQMSFGQAATILSWDIPDTLISMMRGQRLRMLLRPHFTGAYPNFKYKLRIMAGPAQGVYETDWIRETEAYARHWLDMFDLRMPPWLEGETDLRELTLELMAAPTEAGTWTWAFDDVMLFAQDSFATVDCDVAPGGKVVISGDKGWAETDTGKKYGLRKMVGSLMLKPMRYHLFYFAMHGRNLNQAPIDFLVGVTGKYRPRRRSL